MREFNERERRYILKKQSTLTLGQLANRFKCNWKDIYNCYSEMLENGEYLAFEKEYREMMLKKTGVSKFSLALAIENRRNSDE